MPILTSEVEERARLVTASTGVNGLRNKLDISEIINIFTSEDMENMPPGA